MGWGNPIVGSVVLRRPAIQSPNYVKGISGWAINQDGTAEFNSLSIRGTFNGTNFVINSSGAFFYSGTPAAGNLIGSIAASGGTDAYGNAYKPGITSYNAGYSAQLYQAELSVHHSGMMVDGQVYGNESGSASVGPSMVLRSPSDAAAGAHVSTVLVYGQSSDGTWASRILLAGWTDASLTTEEPIKVRVNGAVYATDPVNGGAEGWHPLPLTNSWANAGNPPAGQYRKTAENEIEVIGRLSHAAVTGTSQIATALPAGYIPTHTQDLQVNTFGNTAGPGQSPVLTLDNLGVLTCFFLPANTTGISFHNFYSLDA